ncbi:uncharacterized protein PV06_08902 [Exophiala oligosperma]|uniref:Velvet domain-containing protein n=1 Tax=Exophiala oligosperma TaxID=215243 RepID=A0A0D2AG50_9EURO|nr:uncharacterized protein PV06_08902 [Exophiala oligosperma]KIW39091.1 hypothetical protein PV06_08902 [Exophiala oligosperma]
MELAIGPPSRIAAGVPIESPIVVTFAAAKPENYKTKDESDDDFEDVEGMMIADFDGVWVLVSLTTPQMDQSLAPPRTDLLRGRTADSIHAISQEQEGDIPTLAYATFTDIVITEPGRYRIKVYIIDMNRTFMQQADGEPTILPCLYSPVFEVLEESEQDTCGKTIHLCVKQAEVHRHENTGKAGKVEIDWSEMLDGETEALR